MPTRRCSFFSAKRNAASTAVGSAASTPRMALNTSAQSSADRASGPILSRAQQRDIAPARLTLPKLGRKPVVPQTSHGDTLEPSVSLPIAKGTSPAATVQAEPAEEPLEPFSGSQGFRVLPPYHTSSI